MTRTLNASTGRTAPTDRRSRASAAPAKEHAPRAAPTRPAVRTLLVASCGWPTETTAPTRRRTSRG